MKFRTPLAIDTVDNKISLKDPLITIGSCFADNIGNKFLQNKFDVLANPYGVIFDPLSLSRLLSYSLQGEEPAPDTYIEVNGVFKNLELHSSFIGLSKEELHLKIKARIKSTGDFIKSAKWLIITFGTAHVYQYKKTGQFVANCHKLPADNYTRALLSVATITDSMEVQLKSLRSINPQINIILTVSPVRHTKDGLAANNLSKSILRVASHELANHAEGIYYYPAYEILIDDLRNYRFYKDDMIHPNDQAIAYTWEHFIQTYADKKTQSFLGKWEKINQALHHRPFNPSHPNHQQFLKKLLDELLSIQAEVNVDKELKVVQEQIVS